MAADKERTPFAMPFLPWVDEWRKSGMSGLQFAVMTYLCSNLRRDGGKWYGWYKRKQMAENLGVTEQSIREAIRCLKKRGFLKLRKDAHNGWCQEYWIMPDFKGEVYRPPKHMFGVSTDTTKGCVHATQRGRSPNTPTISEKCGSGSLSRPTAQENERQEAARRRYAERLRNVV